MVYYSGRVYIGKGVLFVLVVVLCLNFVLAEGSWDSFDGEKDFSEVFVEDLSELGVNESESFDDFNLEDSFVEEGDSFEYTLYFYIALGVGVAGLLITILFIYLLLKRPKNKWKK